MMEERFPWEIALRLAEAGIVVQKYSDDAQGTMIEDASDGGRFSEVVLKPSVEISSASDPARASALHEQAHHLCFIANAMNFPVRCEPCVVAAKSS